MTSPLVVRAVHPEPSLTVYHSPERLVLLLIGAVAFVAAELWVIISGVGLVGLRSVTVRAIGAAAVVLFGANGIFLAGRLVQRRPALVLDRRGITDHVAAVSAGLVPWEEIAGLGTWSMSWQTYVTVQVVNPAAVLARVGPVTRAAMRANLRWFGSPTPVLLTTIALPLSHEQLIAEIEAFASRA